MASMTEFSTAESRGQLILVGGVVIAALLITAGMVFNTALFTNAQATSNTFSDTTQGENFKESVHIDIKRLIAKENAQMDGNANTDTQELIQNIDTYTHATQSNKGALTTISHKSTTLGTRIEWTDSTKRFENQDGNATWVVTDGISDIRKFTITPSENSLASLTNPSKSTIQSSAFGVKFNPTHTENTTVYMYEDSGAVEIHTMDETGTTVSRCSIQETPPMQIAFSTETLRNKYTTTSCQALWPNADVDAIQYTNGDNIKGEFEYTVHNGNTVYHDNIDTAQAIYDMDIRYQYQASGSIYKTTTKIAPREP